LTGAPPWVRGLGIVLVAIAMWRLIVAGQWVSSG